MSTLPSWTSDPESLNITEEVYDALPDDIRKLIEVIGGNVVLCQSGSAAHSNVARRLANRLESARPEQPCMSVATDIDVQFVKRHRKDGKFSFRRPDVSVYRCINRTAKVMTSDTLMVVEVVSPGSGYTDTVDKLAEYAYEGIPVYLVVFLDGDLFVKMVQEYRLDWASRSYRLADTHMDVLVLEEPISTSITFAELDG
jgi:Uma2 family endonuclease